MRILSRIWNQQPGSYFCISTKTTGGTWRDHFFKRTEFCKVRSFVESNMDKNLYWCPHGFNKPKRLKSHAVMPKLLWSDLDEVNPNKASIKPTIAWESSPGRYSGLWVLNRQIHSDELNKRLTYHIGADKGGWDLTQVLRIPGTVNYKYRSQPKTKLLWTDGPNYTIAAIKKKVGSSHDDDNIEGEFVDVWKKYEKALPRWVRKEILNGKPTPGKRSDVLWKIENAMMESGLPLDDAILIIKNSPWNKFAGRKDEISQIRREFEKIVESRLKSPETEKTARYNFLNVTMEDVEDKPVDWLWYPYLARGELTILEGTPDVGKSYLMNMVCKAVCDGEKLPCSKEEMSKRVRGKVAYFDIENSSSITKSRLVSNGLKNLHHFIIEEEPFSIDEEELWDQACEAIGRVKPELAVFDTLNTYIGMTDTYNAAESQQAFNFFRQIARQYHIPVVVIRHWNKSNKDKSLIDRGQGSISFTGLARVVMAAIPHPEQSDWRLLAVIKLNIGRKPLPLSYCITASPTKKDPDGSKFIWGNFENIDFERASNSKAPAADAGRHGENLIRERLSHGKWVYKSKLIALGESNSISQRTIERILKGLQQTGIVARKLKGKESMFKLR